MLKKLKFIYLHHFKIFAFLNFSFTIYLVYLFLLIGFDKVNLYTIVVAFKLITYAFTLVIEKLFFSKRSIYYRNLGLSYRKILGVYFILDFIIFISLILICFLCRNFI